MSTPQRDAIANYLLQYFIEGKDCDRPMEIPHNTLFSFARRNLSRVGFEQQSLSNRKDFISGGVMALTSVLHSSFDESDSNSANELSLKLEDVYSRKSQSLRPFLDILIARGFYPDPDTASIVRLEGKPVDKADSERAWQQEYQGTAHQILLQNIQSSFVQGTAYANSGAIIQSSGYGKSRTVDQMATLIPTIPMNIRALEDEKQGAFPPADAPLIEIFDNIATSPNPVKSLFLFFKLLFDLIRNMEKDLKGDNFAASLYHLLRENGRRARLFADLLEKMGKNPGEATVAEALGSFWELADLIPDTKGKVKLVIYIDEAHTLASKTRAGASMYDHMLKATAEFATVGVFFLFLSTASRLEVLASQSALSASARFQLAHDSLVAPFTEMPFDCHPSLVKEPIQPGLKLEDIRKFSFAARFGRPLFWAYFEAMVLGDKSQAEAHTSTLGMAQAKLISNTSSSISEMNPAGKLAILDVLLNLEYDPQRTHSHQLASRMVASHLRTVYSVPASRAYMHTGYPSEPVLAEAALTFANQHPEKDILGPLLPLFRDVDAGTAGAIDKGERGENVGKMVLLLAYMAAVEKHQKPDSDRILSWGHGCSLIHFLEELTGDRFTSTVLESVPDNLPGGAALKNTFEKSWVRFTHFARAADDSAMTSSMAWVAFVRGMAMIGWRSQQVVDICIPVLLDKDKPVEEANITVILVQLKVREHATSRSKVAVWEDKIKCFPLPNSSRDAFAGPTASENMDAEKAYRTRPYISLVMELGLVVSSNSAAIPSKVVDFLDQCGGYNPPPTSQKKHQVHLSVSNVHVTLPPARRKIRTSSDPIHPRYSLFYHGCSHKVYRCIPDTTAARDVCRTLLQIPTVFNDRPSNRPIEPVLQMKPFWNSGSNCFTWINEPYLKPKSQQNEPEDEEVLIGTANSDVDMEDDSALNYAMDQDQ